LDTKIKHKKKSYLDYWKLFCNYYKTWYNGVNFKNQDPTIFLTWVLN
jgi:hypothetical protein